MSKNLYVAGESGNPTGRPKGSRYSIQTTKGRIERFLAKNMSARALQAMYNKLSEKDKCSFLIELLPYVTAKKTATALTNEDIDRLYSEIMEANQGKTIIQIPDNGRRVNSL